MKIKNEKEIFDLFVEDENGLIEALKAPFIQENDGRVWASECHILIMVNPECISGKYETRGFGSKIPVRDYNCDKPLLVSDLQDALDRCPQEDEVIITYKKVICPECDGNGEVEADYYAEHHDTYYTIKGTCPICDGSRRIDEEVRTPTGKKIPQGGSIIKLGKGYFQWRYIDTIIKTCEILKIEKIKLVRTSIFDSSIIELSSDIHIGIMPMYLNDDQDMKKSAIKVKFTKQ